MHISCHVTHRSCPGKGSVWLRVEAVEGSAAADARFPPHQGWLITEDHRQLAGLPGGGAGAPGCTSRRPGRSRHGQSEGKAHTDAAQPFAH